MKKGQMVKLCVTLLYLSFGAAHAVENCPEAYAAAGGASPSKLAKMKDTLRTVRNLDIWFPFQKYYSGMIKKTAKRTRTERVPIKKLLNIITMDNVKKDENDERALRIAAHRDEIAAAGALTRDVQAKIFTETEPMSVFKDLQGRYVAFDGNGRLQSLEMVYGKYSDLEVEVEVFDKPALPAVSFLTWIRKQRGVENKGL
jgi:hypothetical protein